MTDDIRIKFSFIEHLKTKRLIRECGDAGVTALLSLWIYAAQNCPKGNLKDMDSVDIEDVAKWKGEPGKFFESIKDDWLEKIGDEFHLHDWEEHQHWVFYSKERSEQARNAGIKSGQARAKRKDNEQPTDRSTVSSTGSPTECEPLSSPFPSSPILTKDKSSDKSKLAPYIAFAKELFPDSKNSQLEKQGDVLEKIVRIDNASWEYLKQVLRWAVRDDFWSGNFLSCAPLRTRKPAGDVMKYQKIIRAYQKATGKTLQGHMCASSFRPHLIEA